MLACLLPLDNSTTLKAKATMSTSEADIPEELREELRARLKRIGAGIKGKKMLVDIDVETMSDKMKRLTSGTSTEGYGTSAPTEVRGEPTLRVHQSICDCGSGSASANLNIFSFVFALRGGMQASSLVLTHKSVKYRRGKTTTIKAPYGPNVFAVCATRNPREFFFNWADGLLTWREIERL